ncbi:hypothetical protein QJS04_geneDACA013077 [Acorus gramineus]|uniref:Jacalin-type lectin domain-containing protein n=1 Tax=Acorus gramineus TaxID=55184 RepID=A0AAV9B5K2_ACOGR|nr:hypothetical protein QJS04_geneDACA013077 [Acorus gramineus]
MYGPYGTDDSISTFTIPTKDSEIVGFFGASGKYLDKIGVYLKPRDEPESRSA